MRTSFNLLLLLAPLALIAADCHESPNERRTISTPAPARGANALISGRYDVGSMLTTDQYIGIPRTLDPKKSRRFPHTMTATDTITSVQILMWLQSPLDETGAEVPADLLEYRLTAPSGTTTGFRKIGTLTRAESNMTNVTHASLFDGESPTGTWYLDLLDGGDGVGDPARYINSVLRVNDGVPVSAAAATLNFAQNGVTLDVAAEHATHGVPPFAFTLENVFVVPDVGFVEDFNVFATFSFLTSSGFDPLTAHVLLIAPSGNAFALNPSEVTETGSTSAGGLDTRDHLLTFGPTMRGEQMNGAWRLLIWDSAEDGETGTVSALSVAVSGRP